MKCPSSEYLLTGPVTSGRLLKGGANVESKKIVLVGTGKIGRSTCRNLVDYLGTHNITLINRTAETAAELAKEMGLKSAPMEQLNSELADADIILISTSAAEPVILKRHLEGKGDKLVIDLSVPCNVAVEAQTLPGITFVDVDMPVSYTHLTLPTKRIV